ncbi:7SK snRNA methylphosphate capping enzyme-like [Periplaneta americana]|uniref:7SK snRNA methylphosphate capping enzyme-like n=1 Tax=Periplaneta americana TaxID=6978 RepID=UPI0037E7FD34
MSSAQVQRPVKVDSSEEKTAPKNKSRSKENERAHRKSTSNATGHFPKKHKYENDGRNFKFGRKRAQSFSMGGGKFFPPYKRRKKEGTIIPPTKFLLGGNIYDPLNLNSLQDEEINRAMNAVTPKSSPLPTPRHRKGEIEVIIPPNLHDPLNLISCEDDAEYEQQLVSPTKRGRKSRNRKKKRNSSSGGSSKEDGLDSSTPVIVNEGDKIAEEEKDATVNETIVDTVPVSAQENPAKRELNLDLSFKEKDKKGRKGIEDTTGNGKDGKTEKKRKSDMKDKIVSPVIPQPGAWKRPPQYGHRGGGNMARGDGPAPDGRFSRFRTGGSWQQKREQNMQPMPNFNKKNEYFQYGNYLRYYGYRNPQHEIDLRLKYFAERKELFQDKDVLDIGCNIGHVTLIVARDFGARSVVGLDIDRKLIGIARKNVRHYVNCADSPPNNEADSRERERVNDSRFFPISMPILYGPVDIPGISHGQSPSASKKFPHNVTFIQGNYVLDSDTLLATEQPQFDVILCLSITKWLHLNWGDAGLKQAFRRMYLQLRPGGHLILEPQAWESYKKKKNLTETIFKNYNSIEFFPQKFTEYLLSSEVGFTKCEVIGTPFHQSKGFQRPIQLFTKGEISPSRSAASNTNTPSHTLGTGISRPPVYVAVSMSSREADDDDAVSQECVAGTYVKSDSAADEFVAMETDEIERMDEQCISEESVQNVKDIKSEVSVMNDDSITEAMNVDNSISNVESDLTLSKGEEVEIKSEVSSSKEEEVEIKSEVTNVENVCDDKSQVEMVPDDLRQQEEVVSIEVAKVDTGSEKLPCDEEETVSVKVETSA